MKLKKILVIATIVMLCSIVFTGVSNAATSAFKNVTVGNVTGENGKEVTVNITANADMSIEDGGLVLKYDGSKLEYVKHTEATINGLMIGANDNGGTEGFKIGMLSTTKDDANIKKGTVLATVTFKVLAKGGEKATLTLIDDDAGETVSTGSVTVKAVETTKPAEETEPTTTEPTTTKPATTEPTTKPATTEPTTTKPATTEPTTTKPATTEPTTTKPATTEPTTTKPATTKPAETKPATTKPATTTAKPAKDETPKTGVVEYTSVASLIVLASAIGLVAILKRK